MRLSRPCYDKPHRCPGWAGGGNHYAKTDRCDNGSIRVNVIEHPELDDPKDRLGHPGAHPWRLGHCGTCDVVTLPYIIRKVDPTNIADEIRRTVRRIRWAIRDRFGR